MTGETCRQPQNVCQAQTAPRNVKLWMVPVTLCGDQVTVMDVRFTSTLRAITFAKICHFSREIKKPVWSQKTVIAHTQNSVPKVERNARLGRKHNFIFRLYYSLADVLPLSEVATAATKRRKKENRKQKLDRTHLFVQSHSEWHCINNQWKSAHPRASCKSLQPVSSKRMKEDQAEKKKPYWPVWV